MELYNSDCLTKLKDLSSNSVDLIICDLPFGCLSTGKPERKRFIDGKDTGTIVSGQTIGGCDWDVKIDLEAFWKEIKRVRKDDHTPCLHFCTTKYGFDLYNSNPKEFRYDLVWDKGRGVSFLSANKMPMRSHEMVYVFSKAGAYYNRVDMGENDGTKRCVKSVISQSTSGGKGKHPTEKPIELYKFLIERYCPKGGTVLDPTFGSGNSGLAARELGRKYIGIEKDKEFYDKFKKIITQV